MKISGLALVAVILNSVVPALAQQDMIKGVYARSPEQCAEAKKDFDTFIENGETVLTNRGIEGIEYNCEFVDWRAATRSLGAVATMLCEEPGYAYPEIYAVMPRAEGELEFSSPLTSAASENPGNAGVYYLCEGVTMP